MVLNSHNSIIENYFDVPPYPGKHLYLKLVYEGIEKKDEGLLIFNGNTVTLLPNRNIEKIDTYYYELPKNKILKRNLIQFEYNTKTGDSLEGFAIYKVEFVYKD
jgi:hypothetical protein